MSTHKRIFMEKSEKIYGYPLSTRALVKSLCVWSSQHYYGHAELFRLP